MSDLNLTDAIIWNGRSFSWQLLESYVHSTSRRLKEVGVKPGDRVLIEAIPAAGTVIILFALWHIGAVACPFDPRLTESLMNDFQCKCKPLLALIGAVSGRRFIKLRSLTINDMICIEPVEQFFAGALTIREHLIGIVEQDATILFTSGSTGGPKAVLHTLGAHFANAQGASSVIPFQADDRWLISLPLYRISGIAVLFRALIGYGTIIFSDTDIASAIIRHKPSHISLVPTQFLRLLDILLPEDFTCFKAILIGGAPIPDILIKKAIELGLPVFLTYGMTETASQIATARLPEAAGMGAKILPSFEVIIINNEICVRGPVLLKGYVDGDKLITPFDNEGWFHTGDLGEADGFLKVSGRRDRMFVSGGENIVPEIIEKALLSFDGVLYAKVEPKDDPVFGKAVVAIIALREKFQFDQEGMKWHLKKILMPFQIPKQFFIIECPPGCLKSDK